MKKSEKRETTERKEEEVAVVEEGWKLPEIRAEEKAWQQCDEVLFGMP